MMKAWYQYGDALVQEIERTALPEELFALWPLGQMGAAIKWKETTLLVDPVLADLKNAQGTTRRCFPPPFAPEKLTVNAVLCTHRHADHIQMETLKPIHDARPGCKFIVPAPERAGVIEMGLDEKRVIGAKAGEELILDGDIRLLPVAAAHDTYRTDANGDQHALGYVIRMGENSCFHAGDTVLTQKLIDDLLAAGPVTVACLPVNGLDFERTARGVVGNMDELDAAYLACQIGAEMVIPMHFDMVQGNTSDPLRFAAVMCSRYPGKRWHVPIPGERIILG